MAAKSEDQAERTARSAASASSPANASGRTVGKKRRLASAPPPAQAPFEGAAVRATRSSLDRASSTGKPSTAKGSGSSCRNGSNASGASSGKENRGSGNHPGDKRRFARRTRPPTPTGTPPVQQEEKKSSRAAVGEPPSGNSGGVSETTTFLFQMNCRMLQSQLLEYDVQLSELDEKSALVQAERTRWENKIARMQWKLRELDERNGVANDSDPAAASANSNAPRQPSASAEHQQPSSSDNNNNGMLTALYSTSGQTDTATLTDTVTPSSVELVESEIQETMRKRRQRLSDIIKTLHGVDGLPDTPL